MSAEACTWAVRQRLRGPEEKLVLLLLANEADHLGYVGFGDAAAAELRLADAACMRLESYRGVCADLLRHRVVQHASGAREFELRSIFLRLSLDRDFGFEPVAARP